MKTDQVSWVGQTFNEMYRIVRPIGTGGMGAVFEAVHTRLAHKRYAVKMLHASIAQDAEVFQRFRREAEIATELGHPNIVEVHDFNITPDGAPYMVMEYLEGEDLAARLQKRGPVSLDVMARIISEVCSGLDAAHNAGIVHRDLKPQNIFLCKKLGRDDFVKIVDFGISKVKDSSSVVTRDHSLMGTPFYMSPEQADGLVQQIDSRTDIFALGAIMFEMLTGRMAFEAPTISGAMYKVVHVDPPEVHTVRGDVPPAVSLVLRRALAKHKDYRYPNVMELSHEFGAALRGIPPAIMPPPMSAIPATIAPGMSGNMMGAPPTTPPLATPGGVGYGSQPPVPGVPAGWGSQQAVPGSNPPPGTPPPAWGLPPTAAPALNTPYPRAATPGPALQGPSQPGVPYQGPSQPGVPFQGPSQAGMAPSQPTPVPAARPSDPGASGQVPQSKPRTGLFIGIGVGVVAIAAGLFIFLSMNKKKEDPGQGSGSELAGSQLGSGSQADPGSGSQAVTNPGSGSKADPGSGSGSEVVTNPGSGSGSQVATDPGSGSGSQAEAPVPRQYTMSVEYDGGVGPKDKAPYMKLNGKKIDGLTFELEPGVPARIEVIDSNWSAKLSIDKDQAPGVLPIKLKKKGGSGSGSIWLPN